MKDFLETEIARQQDKLADANAEALTAVAADCPNIAAAHVAEAQAIVETIGELMQEHEKEENDADR